LFFSVLPPLRRSLALLPSGWALTLTLTPTLTLIQTYVRVCARPDEDFLTLLLFRNLAETPNTKL
jgi:hypothetical protein